MPNWNIGGNAVNIANPMYQELEDRRMGEGYYDHAGRHKGEAAVPGSSKYTGIWNEYSHKNECTFKKFASLTKI